MHHFYRIHKLFIHWMKQLIVVSLMIALVLPTVIVPQEVEARTRADDAPKLANWYYKWSIDSKKEAKELAEWDVLILDVETAFYSRKRLEYIKELNPDIKLLAYFSPTDNRTDSASLDEGNVHQKLGVAFGENPEWILKDSQGNPVQWWPGNYIFNLTKVAPKGSATDRRYASYFPEFIQDNIIEDTIWDGVFYDNLWEGLAWVNEDIDIDGDGIADDPTEIDTEWKKGMRTILSRTKERAKESGRKKFIVTGNGGVLYNEQVNGIGFEHFPYSNYTNYDWSDALGHYDFILSDALTPQYAFLNTNTGNKNTPEDYQLFRYGLITALLNDGHYSFDMGDGSHTQRWWYDEYEISLGEPISGAFNVLDTDNPTKKQEGVWRRDYESVIVLVNSTNKKQKVKLSTGFEKIQGSQDTDTNDGSVVGSVTIPAKDGIMLLRRLSVTRDATFINGAYSKVFDYYGEEVRNSFFASDGSFSGGTQIHKLSQNGKTIVADDTYVRVYDSSNREISRFAPYGEEYTGGVNIAVGKLFGDKKKKKNKNYIVTGNKTGRSRVRIFNMKGKVVNDGCYPYAEGFNGGVNVGIGDLNGDKRQEIVVAAGYGGGPHVRVLNNECTVINPGFFAYEEHLRIGVNMAVGDVDGDGKAEIITGAGPGGGPHIRIFNRKGKLINPGFFAYSTDDRSGVLVGTADIDKDGILEIITSSFGIFNTF